MIILGTKPFTIFFFNCYLLLYCYFPKLNVKTRWYKKKEKQTKTEYKLIQAGGLRESRDKIIRSLKIQGGVHWRPVIVIIIF